MRVPDAVLANNVGTNGKHCRPTNYPIALDVIEETGLFQRLSAVADCATTCLPFRVL